MRQDEPVELDAFGPDRAIDQWMGAVIIAAGDRQLQCHNNSLCCKLRRKRSAQRDPHPSLSHKWARVTKETHIWSACFGKFPSPIPMGEGEGEGIFMLCERAKFHENLLC